MDKRFVPAATIAIIVMLSLFVVKPKVAEVYTLKKTNVDQRKYLSRLTDKAQQLQSIDPNEILVKVKKVEDVFPSQRPILDLMNTIEILASEEIIPFEGLSLAPGKIAQVAADKIQSFNLTFSVGGKLANIASFISKLERVPPLMKIEKIDLSVVGKNEASKSANKVLTNFTVKVYYQLPPDKIGAVDSPFPVLAGEDIGTLEKINGFREMPKIQPNATVGRLDPFSPP